jgi:hypothetical protein
MRDDNDTGLVNHSKGRVVEDAISDKSPEIVVLIVTAALMVFLQESRGGACWIVS